MKFQVRKKVIKELVIGKFLVNTDDPQFMRESISALLKAVRRAAGFSFVSVAVNPLTQPLVESLEACGFRKINKSIYFIAKGELASSVNDWSNWWMFRSDIDTW
jgi:hypothetical protein